jgi:hypothetical protein
MQEKVPIILKNLTLIQYTGVGLMILAPILFCLMLPPSCIDFLFFIALILLGSRFFILSYTGKNLPLLLKREEILSKKYKFLKNKIVFEYKNKKFEIVLFSGFSFRGFLDALYYSWGTLDFGVPESHLEIWTKTKADVSYIRDPYRKILRKLHKPHKYIEEDLKEYGENISDLFFLSFTKRGKDKYLLAMLDWDTKPYVLSKVLDAMSEIVEKYDKR